MMHESIYANVASSAVEYLLADELMSRHISFTPSRRIGGYVVDFWFADKKLVIELDGAYHWSTKQAAKDAARTQFLEQTYGITVVRIADDEVWADAAGVADLISLILAGM